MPPDLMYGDYSGSEDKKRKTLSPRAVEKGLRRLLIIAAVVLAAECLWLFVISPCIPLSTIEVNGFAGFNGSEVLNYAGIGEKASFVSVNAKAVQSAIARYHLVESVRVVKRFPDRLTLFLEPRKAVGLSLAVINGRQMPVYFDRHGVVFGIGNETPAAAQSSGQLAKTTILPVISGLIIEEPSLGMKLPAALAPLLQEIGKIADSVPHLLEAVSEIQVSRKLFDGYDLVLYPVHYPVQVKLGSTINEETLRYVLLMLDVFETRGIMPAVIDYRAGLSSYTVKEASSD